MIFLTTSVFMFHKYYGWVGKQIMADFQSTLSGENVRNFVP